MSWEESIRIALKVYMVENLNYIVYVRVHDCMYTLEQFGHSENMQLLRKIIM